MNAGKLNNFARYAWAVLGYNIFVILLGAFVRSSGSGAGCGSHWPLCNGEVLPRAPEVATLIEFSHRLTSGLALLLVGGLLLWARRLYAPGQPVRVAAMWSMVFILVEALVGAALVLLELVAGNPALLRGVVIAVHLANTLLLGALTLCAWHAGGGAPVQLPNGAGAAASSGWAQACWCWYAAVAPSPRSATRSSRRHRWPRACSRTLIQARIFLCACAFGIRCWQLVRACT